MCMESISVVFDPFEHRIRRFRPSSRSFGKWFPKSKVASYTSDISDMYVASHSITFYEIDES